VGGVFVVFWVLFGLGVWFLFMWGFWVNGGGGSQGGKQVPAPERPRGGEGLASARAASLRSVENVKAQGLLCETHNEGQPGMGHPTGRFHSGPAKGRITPPT